MRPILIEINVRLDVPGKTNALGDISQRTFRAQELLERHAAVKMRRCDFSLNRRMRSAPPVPLLLACMEIDDWERSCIYFHQVARALDQDCIAVLDASTNRGQLLGPGSPNAGAFDFERFHRWQTFCGGSSDPGTLRCEP